MELYQAKKLLHSKGNTQQSERAADRIFAIYLSCKWLISRRSSTTEHHSRQSSKEYTKAYEEAFFSFLFFKLKKFFYVYLKSSYRETDRHRPSICYFTPQMAIKAAKPGLGWIQNPETSCGSPRQVQESKYFGHLLLLSEVHQHVAELEGGAAETWTNTYTLCSCCGSNLTCCTTMPAPNRQFSKNEIHITEDTWKNTQNN